MSAQSGKASSATKQCGKTPPAGQLGKDLGGGISSSPLIKASPKADLLNIAPSAFDQYAPTFMNVNLYCASTIAMSTIENVPL